jgi:hypothetical protein
LTKTSVEANATKALWPSAQRKAIGSVMKSPGSVDGFVAKVISVAVSILAS